MKKSSIDRDILFEDNHLIIVNKRPSDIVQGDRTGDEPLSERVARYLAEKYHKPGDAFIGVVHRLDRPVSGAVIFARTSKALTRLNQMLREGSIRKTYWAVVGNRPPNDEDHLVGYLTRNTSLNKTFVQPEPSGESRKAELKYRVAGKSNEYYLLEVELMTGRHHQIRAQLSAIGCPIKGDLKYGFPRSNPDGSIHLHARMIELVHPVRKEPLKVIAAPPPDTLWDFFLTRTNLPGE